MRFYTSTILWSLISTSLVGYFWAGQVQTSNLPTWDQNTPTLASKSQQPRDKTPHRGSGRVEPAKAVALAKVAQTEQSGDKSPPRGSSRRATRNNSSETKPAAGIPGRGSGRYQILDSPDSLFLG